MTRHAHHSLANVTFYQSHLDQVSRSFAFCIRELQAPLREWTSLAYLLCRTLDTVEDSAWSSLAVQTQQYVAFEQFIAAPPPQAAVDTWVQAFPPSVAQGEQALLAEAHRLFAALHALPTPVQQATRQAVLRMCAGMRHYTERPRPAQSRMHLMDAIDVNRYCYFVAGVVGHLLTQLYGIAHHLATVPDQLRRNAFHFGLFLQKINLLKDQPRDEAEGRYLVPDRQALIAGLRQHAEGALDYVKALSHDAKAYRTFCGWSLFLGAASLPAIEAAFAGEGLPKLPRQQTQALLHSVAEVVQDNAAMERAFNTYAACLPKSPPSAPRLSTARAGEDWFTPIAGDLLGADDYLALGLIA